MNEVRGVGVIKGKGESRVEGTLPQRSKCRVKVQERKEHRRSGCTEESS